MDTIRVDICYRPLRIGWAIRAGDMDSFRQAVKYSYAFWGGRFNPILIIDNEEEARWLIDLFRVDLIIPLGTSDEVKEFPKKFPYLINPFFHEPLFFSDEIRSPSSQVLDVLNALMYLRDRPVWTQIKEKGVQVYSWFPDDPLADVFMMQLGMYPSADDVGHDYREMLMKAAEAKEVLIDKDVPVPFSVLDHPSIPYISSCGLERHHGRSVGWNCPGFFFGDATNLDDLVCHWNLQAADIPIWFVDQNHLQRYTNLIPAWETLMREAISHRHEFDRNLAVWSRNENVDEIQKPFSGSHLMI